MSFAVRYGRTTSRYPADGASNRAAVSDETSNPFAFGLGPSKHRPLLPGRATGVHPCTAAPRSDVVIPGTGSPSSMKTAGGTSGSLTQFTRLTCTFASPGHLSLDTASVMTPPVAVM